MEAKDIEPFQPRRVHHQLALECIASKNIATCNRCHTIQILPEYWHWWPVVFQMLHICAVHLITTKKQSDPCASGYILSFSYWFWLVCVVPFLQSQLMTVIWWGQTIAIMALTAFCHIDGHIHSLRWDHSEHGEHSIYNWLARTAILTFRYSIAGRSLLSPRKSLEHVSSNRTGLMKAFVFSTALMSLSGIHNCLLICSASKSPCPFLENNVCLKQPSNEIFRPRPPIHSPSSQKAALESVTT